MPSSRSRRTDLTQLIARPFAHRGLHGEGRIENSRAAFAAAIASGQGIELDVQASRDGEAMVFHDERLDRLTAETGALAAIDANALGRIGLTGSDDRIERLSEILRLIGGRVPLLIEVKARRRGARALARSVATAL